MALHITNSVVERKIRDLAIATGVSITDAIGAAAEEKLARIRPVGPNSPAPSVEEIQALMRSFRLQPINEDLTDEEILGYGPEGFCE